MYYRRTFTVPAGWSGRRVQLNFGAVDWQSTVWVNGTLIGTHEGGYDTFSFDITGALRGGTNEIIVGVWDPDRRPGHPGRQAAHQPRRHLLHAASGIWQTVWLEPTAAARITRLDTTPNVAAGGLDLVVQAAGGTGADGDRSGAQRRHGGRHRHRQRRRALRSRCPTPGSGRPDDPFLYDLRVTLAGGDAVGGYFGMRSLGKAMVGGVLRPTAQRQVRLPDRHPRPGLLAGRHLHRADRRGAAPSTWSSRRRSASTWSASTSRWRRPLVLPRRPARPDGLAGHAVAGQRPGAVGRRAHPVRAGAARDGRRAPGHHVDRAVGAVQRGLGRVRRRPHRRSGQELGPDPAGQPQLRLQLLRLRPGPGQRRRDRRPHVRRPGHHPAADGHPDRGPRRVRRPRPAGARSRVADRRQVRLRVAARLDRADQPVRADHRQAAST